MEEFQPQDLQLCQFLVKFCPKCTNNEFFLLKIEPGFQICNYFYDPISSFSVIAD